MNDQSNETKNFLEDVAKRLAEVKHAEKCVKACAGLPEGALDDGWTASGISAYAKSLEEAVQEMATTFKGIIEADWLTWQELASPDEFIGWAKCRANHMIEKYAGVIKASEKPHA